jgi:hypothetical protein
MKKLNCMNGYLTRIDFGPVPFFANLHLLKFEMKSQAKPSQAKPSQAKPSRSAVPATKGFV